MFAAPYFSRSSQECCSSCVFSDFRKDGLISPTCKCCGMEQADSEGRLPVPTQGCP